MIGDAAETDLIVEKIHQVMNGQKIPSLHITGNLPFQIAGKLLAQWNRQSLLKTGLFSLADNVEMTLIFSRKMGEKLLPTFSKRTRFSTITQTAFDVSHPLIYPKEAFTPRPACDAIGLKFQNRKKLLFRNEKELDNYYLFLGHIYALPNKQIGTVFSKVSDKKQLLDELEISYTERVFSVPIHKLLKLSKMVYPVL